MKSFSNKVASLEPVIWLRTDSNTCVFLRINRLFFWTAIFKNTSSIISSQVLLPWNNMGPNFHPKLNLFELIDENIIVTFFSQWITPTHGNHISLYLKMILIWWSTLLGLSLLTNCLAKNGIQKSLDTPDFWP